MALGGGSFITQNKVLPGSYINFISAARASATLSERGVAAMALELDWGLDGQVFRVDSADFQKESTKYFGYDYTHPKMKGLRDLFTKVRTGYFYKLNTGVKAANAFGTATCGGVRGNDLKTVIEVSIEDPAKFDVKTFLGTSQRDLQTVESASQLVDNDWVNWKKDAILSATAGTPFIGGSNGPEVNGEAYQVFLDKIERYAFNTLGCLSEETSIIDLYVQFTKRMRNEVGVKFQTVVYRTPADFEGVISVENTVLDEGASPASLVYWVTGATAGCEVNKSNTNKLYDGSFLVDTDYKQSELEAGILNGKFMCHLVGDDVRVLDDINTFVTYTDEKNSDFSSNQTIRVLDQIGNDIAVLFNTRYLGNVPNDASGRISFWNDIVKHHEQLETIRAIEDFEADAVKVEKGDTKKSVVVTDAVTPTNAMSQLYMTVVVS